MWASFKEIGWVEIAAQLTVEFLLQNIMLVHNWELLQQSLSNAQIPWMWLAKIATSRLPFWSALKMLLLQ